MDSTYRVDFSADELRLLAQAAFHQLEYPLGVYPGTPRDARAQLTGALKLLRAFRVAGACKFLPLPPNMAPFACELIADTLAPGSIEVTEPPRKRGRPSKSASASRPTRRRPVGAARRASAKGSPLGPVVADTATPEQS